MLTDLTRQKYITTNQITTFSGKAEEYFERDASACFFCGFTAGRDSAVEPTVSSEGKEVSVPFLLFDNSSSFKFKLTSPKVTSRFLTIIPASLCRKIK